MWFRCGMMSICVLACWIVHSPCKGSGGIMAHRVSRSESRTHERYRASVASTSFESFNPAVVQTFGGLSWVPSQETLDQDHGVIT